MQIFHTFAIIKLSNMDICHGRIRLKNRLVGIREHSTNREKDENLCFFVNYDLTSHKHVQKVFMLTSKLYEKTKLPQGT